MASEAAQSAIPRYAAVLAAAVQHGPWRTQWRLSSGLARVERFLADAGSDRAPWAAVALALGIGAWFQLSEPWQWLTLIGMSLAVSLAAVRAWPERVESAYLRQAVIVLPLMVAVGCIMVWTKSSLVGRAAIDRPLVGELSGLVLAVQDQPGEARSRITMATREPGTGRPIRVRLNVAYRFGGQQIGVDDRISVKARLMPPPPPMLPGGYDFARAAWFMGLSATGSALGPVTVAHVPPHGWMPSLASTQAALSQHVRRRLGGSAGGVAATLASGDRGAIAPADEAAMRDAGLAHLLSISGLHVSAVVAAAYALVLRLLAAWPWLALRVRLPLVAAGAGALAGIAYTLVTGAEVPTVRSCIAALLVLGAMALGRQPLSMRMIAVAAFVVMLFWPEAVVGPSFQMSFAAVITIVALHDAAPARAFLAAREQGWLARRARDFVMLLVTGLVIELALMPIAIWHFHRAGIYGAFANMVAIPLTTLLTMPLIALALLLDTVNAGAPAWWLCGKTIDFLLWIAHWIAARPGAVTALPLTGSFGMVLAAAGGLWLALLHGRVRLWGLAAGLVGLLWLVTARPPDILVSGDGHHAALVENGSLVVLRQSRSSFARDNLAEIAGVRGEPVVMADLSGARCNRDFCAFNLVREKKTWRMLMSLGRDPVAERDLAAACAQSDIVVADRWLPQSCRPAWLKADRKLLAQTGGLAIDLASRDVRTVAQSQGRHGWWRGPGDRHATRRSERDLAPRAETASP